MTADGLGAAHQAERRRQLAALWPGQPCPRCGRGLYPGQPLDLDHMIARALGGASGPVLLAHARCNRSAGAALGNRLRSVPGRPAPQRSAPRRHRWPQRCCEVCGASYWPSGGEQRTCGRACGWSLRRRNAAAGRRSQPSPPRPVAAMVTVTSPAPPWRASRDW